MTSQQQFNLKYARNKLKTSGQTPLDSYIYSDNRRLLILGRSFVVVSVQIYMKVNPGRFTNISIVPFYYPGIVNSRGELSRVYAVFGDCTEDNFYTFFQVDSITGTGLVGHWAGEADPKLLDEKYEFKISNFMGYTIVESDIFSSEDLEWICLHKEVPYKMGNSESIKMVYGAYLLAERYKWKFSIYVDKGYLYIGDLPLAQCNLCYRGFIDTLNLIDKKGCKFSRIEDETVCIDGCKGFIYNDELWAADPKCSGISTKQINNNYVDILRKVTKEDKREQSLELLKLLGYKVKEGI